MTREYLALLIKIEGERANDNGQMCYCVETAWVGRVDWKRDRRL